MSPTTAPARSARLLRAVVLALGLTLVLAGCQYSQRQMEVRALVNHSRAVAQEPRTQLGMNQYAARKAQGWAQHLADCQCLVHSNLPDGLPPGWYSIGENIGRSGSGGTIRDVHRWLMHSPPHKRNILGRQWTGIGTGVASHGTEKFVVQVFVQY